GFRGFGGGGHGWRHWFHATGLPGWLRFGDHQPPLPETERRMLEDQAEALKTELSSIEERLSQLESETKQK
ncbi:MAG: DUF5320 domain-containing protein, partial [Verrucomicrobia bacterium]|nr:DUF5320 domain-containing protein [Verrucomicrobiota bacterium]